MANPEKPDENHALATGKSIVDQPEVTLEAKPKTLTEDQGSVCLTVKVTNLPEGTKAPLTAVWSVDQGNIAQTSDIKKGENGQWTGTNTWDVKSVPAGRYEATVRINGLNLDQTTSIGIVGRRVQASVNLQRSATSATDDQALWVAIRNRTDAISFSRFDAFINRLLCAGTDAGSAKCPKARSPETVESPTAKGYGEPSIAKIRESLRLRPNIYGPDAYYLLKLAVQAFLIFESGIVIARPRNPDTGNPDDTQGVPGLEEPESRLGRFVTPEEISRVLETYLGTVVGTAGGRGLPYLKRIVDALIAAADARGENLPYCGELLQHRFSCPNLLELIWSYWEEEGMLVQTMNAITRRFQNRSGGTRDPLANLELDPLRPLNNLLWGFIQDEYNRLTVPRRAYELDHHYGLTLVGKAVPKLESADSRSKFIEAYHNLLNRAAVFYRADSDNTLIADAFPLLNSLKEVHLILAEGAHNQFGDLPWTARAEMLVMQWFLSRNEIREFLRGRHSVPYPEPWMGAVDDMKRLQGWTDTTVAHFHELAVTGERILLSIRYGDWVNLNNTEDQAKNWARYWKPEVQLYIHAYQTATGVDLGVETIDTRRTTERYLQPSVHLQSRLEAQLSRGALPALGAVSGEMESEELGYPGFPSFRRRRLLRQGR